jgi:hypothetical protein
MARDVMLFCQQRDPSAMPNAYPPTNTASAAPSPAQRAELSGKPVSLARAGD